MLSMNDICRKESMSGEEIRDAIKRGIERDNSRPDMLQEAMSNYRPRNNDKFEEIRRYKELLDEGIITENEYESKKQELLEL